MLHPDRLKKNAHETLTQHTERNTSYHHTKLIDRLKKLTDLDVPVCVVRLHPVRVRLRRVLQRSKRDRAIPVRFYPHALSERLACMRAVGLGVKTRSKWTCYDRYTCNARLMMEAYNVAQFRNGLHSHVLALRKLVPTSKSSYSSSQHNLKTQAVLGSQSVKCNVKTTTWFAPPRISPDAWHHRNRIRHPDASCWV